MITAAILQTTIEEIKSITKIDFSIIDLAGITLAKTAEDLAIDSSLALSFIDSQADSQTIGGNHYAKVMDGTEVQYILVARGDYENVFMIVKLVVAQLKNLMIAYKEKFDRNIFFQNLILDNLLLVDIYNRAKKLHIPIEASRLVFLIEMKDVKDQDAMEMLRSLFTMEQGDYLTAVDEKSMILIKSMEADSSYVEAEEIANTIVTMLNTESMVAAKVSYGTIVTELQEVSKSYKEAKMALDVSRIFYVSKSVIAYNTLGIGRLIYQLPINLCKMFIREIFGDKMPDSLNEETLSTIDKFFENNLNVSETSRQLYIHRNTLVYRIDKLEESTGLDLRNFDDALTFKIAMMVVSYMNYLENNK